MSLDVDTRALVRVSAALASRAPGALEGALEEAAGVEPGRVEEALLQSYLFLGYPAALNGLALWREISGVPAGEPVADDWEAWAGRGAEVCGRVYGGQYERLRDNVRKLHPDLERWMVVEGYGKVLGRDGLELATRELCVVAILAVLGAPVQLYSHLRGALHAGAPPEAVAAVLAEAGAFADEPRRADARETWSRVRARSPERESGRS